MILEAYFDENGNPVNNISSAKYIMIESLDDETKERIKSWIIPIEIIQKAKVYVKNPQDVP